MQIMELAPNNFHSALRSICEWLWSREAWKQSAIWLKVLPRGCSE
jgi:hypothetical protein